MSGHSKWHNIQVKKGKSDKIKSSQFTKAARAITIAARTGGADVAANFSLRLAIDKAKEVNMPKDNIERAMKRGTGELEDAAALEEHLYEGFGPGGVAFLIEAITDNKTRTVSDIKNIFSKHGGSVGSPGSVQWQFARQGVVRVPNEQLSTINEQRDDFEMKLIDAGADDIVESEHGFEIRSSIESFQKMMEAVKSFCEKAGLPAEALAEAGLEWVAKENAGVDEETANKVQLLVELLEEHDDVRGVYTNIG